MVRSSTSLEAARESRPSWIPRWVFDVPDAWHAFAEEHPLRLEEFRDGSTYVVRAELPGIDPDHDVEITVADGRLHLRAERREHRVDTDRDRYRSEFTYGAFARTLPLPEGATEADVKASYVDGILEIHVPLAADTPEARKVKVTR